MDRTGGTTDGHRESRPSSPGGRGRALEIRDRFGVAHQFSWFTPSGGAQSQAFGSFDDARRFLETFDRDPWTLQAFYLVLRTSVAAGRGPDPARLLPLMAAALAWGGLTAAPAGGPSSAPGSSRAAPSAPGALAGLAALAEELASEAVEAPRPREPELTWIEVELVGEDDSPIAGEPYRLTLSTGRVLEGTLDAHGRVRIERMNPGTFDLTFPRLDREAWNRA